MRRVFGMAAIALGFLAAGAGLAQDSTRAKQTRENVKKIILDEVDYKDEMTRVIFDDLKRESNNKVSFIIDNTSGMSNNTRMTYKAKKVSIEKILNDLADKNDFGWFVFSNPKDPNDQKNGKIVLRKNSKGKERGYELGTEPKEQKKSSVQTPPRSNVNVYRPYMRFSMSGFGASYSFRPIP